MPKQALAILLFVPLLASAKCSFLRTDNTMTIVVGKKANTCFSSEGFREAFKSDLVEAVNENPPQRPSQKKSIDDRRASSAKLWSLAERMHQANLQSGGFSGKKP